MNLFPDEELDYRCDDCGGVLSVRRYGLFVLGSCSSCGRELEYELPPEALEVTPGILAPKGPLWIPIL